MAITRTTLTHINDREIEITREFNAPRRLVWRAWAEPELIARWWGPRDFNTRVEKHDFKVGGAWRFVLVGPDGDEIPVVGTFREIVPMERFVTTNEFSPDFVNRTGMNVPKANIMTVRFEDLGERTRVVLHIELQTADDRRTLEEMGIVPGWNSSFDCLDELLGPFAQEERSEQS